MKQVSRYFYILLVMNLFLTSCQQKLMPWEDPRYYRDPNCQLGAQIIGPNGEPDSCWRFISNP